MFRRSFVHIEALARYGIRTITTSGRRHGERCMNKVQLLGRIGTDPKMHGTERTMVSFPLATQYHFKVSNEDGTTTEKSRTNWHLVNVRQQSTQQYVMKYIKKGSRVFVGGRIEYLRSQDEQGQTKDLAVIISDEVILLASPRLSTDRDEQLREDYDQDVKIDIDAVDEQ